MTFFLLISFTQSPFWKIENIENQFLYNNCSTELRSHTWKKIPLLPKSKFWRHLLRAKQKKKITQIFSFLVPKSIKKCVFLKNRALKNPTNSSQKSSSSHFRLDVFLSAILVFKKMFPIFFPKHFFSSHTMQYFTTNKFAPCFLVCKPY